MHTSDDVVAMLTLKKLGWGFRRIAKEFGVSKNTVKRYVRNGAGAPHNKPMRKSALDGLDEWLEERFHTHAGNADVVRQELQTVKGIDVSLRTVERAVAGFRAELTAKAKATVRFETEPGEQLQIDFGTVTVVIGGRKERVKLFVATLGYSRRIFVHASRRERQRDWFVGIEEAMRHFGGRPKQLLVDNAKALVKHHNPETREVELNERFITFCHYWDLKPKACAPYRAQTKGKDERAVGYVKRNAIAGREFASWAELQSHLVVWMRDIADARTHGTTGDVPQVRFDEVEAAALRPLHDRTPFIQVLEFTRVVSSDCFVDVDTNRYSVPWQLIREQLTVVVNDGVVVVMQGAKEVARHDQVDGSHQRVRKAEHFEGIRSTHAPTSAATAVYASNATSSEPPAESELLRPLDEYASATGGAW